MKVGRAFSFNKTPSKLKRAMSTMMSPFGSTNSLTPASQQLAQMRLASCNNINVSWLFIIACIFLYCLFCAFYHFSLLTFISRQEIVISLISVRISVQHFKRISLYNTVCVHYYENWMHGCNKILLSHIFPSLYLYIYFDNIKLHKIFDIVRFNRVKLFFLCSVLLVSRHHENI